MKTIETALKSSAAKVGMWMFLSGIIILGPVGFALLCGLAYAMHFSNMALGVVCVLLLFSPLLFLAAWLPLCGAALIEERWAERAKLAAGAISPV